LSEPYFVIGKGWIKLIEYDWKYLIIVDAGRYDIFKKLYKKYFRGRLYKAISPATSTMEWLVKVFRGYYDVVYVSANPYVNSRQEMKDPQGLRYKASEHFAKIVDVWDKGWNKELDTVHPSMVNVHVLAALTKYKSKRMIIHYIQPHHPYIGGKYKKYQIFIRLLLNSQEKLQSYEMKRRNKHKYQGLEEIQAILRDKIGQFIIDYFGIGVYWDIRKLIYKDYTYQPALIYYHEGWEGLKKAYEENYELALKYISRILPFLKGKILITADHGEYLGEYGLYGHGNLPRHKPIIEVPWLEIVKQR